MKKVICSEKAPAAVGPYSQAVLLDGVLYTSGQLGLDPVSGALKEGLEAQARQALDNLGAVLAAAGMSYGDVIKTLVFLKSMDDFAAFNAVYAAYFQDGILPARSCVEVARLPKNGLVEIEAVAKA